MTTAKVLVTLGGVAAVAWVLWYFLAPPRPRPLDRGSKLKR